MNRYVPVYGDKAIRLSICSCLPIWHIMRKCCYLYHFLKPRGDSLFAVEEILILCGLAGFFERYVPVSLAGKYENLE